LGIWSAGQGDDKERFLADLRALRDTAALGYEELAARAHYPSDVLKEAENGPSLPGLPILAAYVRACEGDVPEWEERWRSLGFEVRADPGLPVRPAGASPAAVAGARAGVSVAPPDAYDPERIRAALRGSHVQTDKVALTGAGRQTGEAERWGTGARAEEAAGWSGNARSGVGPGGAGPGGAGPGGAGPGGAGPGGAGPGWDAAADQGSAAANGNHQAWHQGDAPFGATVAEPPDPAAAADALRRDPFSSSWLHDSQPIPRLPDAEPGRQDRAGSDRRSPEDTGQAPPDWTGFWTPAKAAAAPADVQRPAAPPSADEPTTAGTTWSAFTPSLPKITADPAHRPAPDLPQHAELAKGPVADLAGPDPGLPQPVIPALSASTGSAAPARSQTPSEPAVPQPAPASPSESRPDRYYPLRLLAVIVVAALIGSVLVLLLR
jgi:hypothetical protein